MFYSVSLQLLFCCSVRTRVYSLELILMVVKVSKNLRLVIYLSSANPVAVVLFFLLNISYFVHKKEGN